MKIEIAKVTSKGQITIPIAIRKLLNLEKDDRVAFIENDGKVEIASLNKAFEYTYNQVKRSDKTLSMEDSLKDEEPMEWDDIDPSRED